MHAYDKDVHAWAAEQAALLRAGRFDQLDLQHLAEEIEDVGKSERREIKNRLAVLLAHLLKWEHQPERRGSSWDATIWTQRKNIRYGLSESPSLKPLLSDPQWLDVVWSDAVAQAVKETNLPRSQFPETCPWLILDEVLNDAWRP